MRDDRKIQAVAAIDIASLSNRFRRPNGKLLAKQQIQGKQVPLISFEFCFCDRRQATHAGSNVH